MKKRRYRKHGPFSLKLKKQTIYTVGAIWLWLFAGVILLSFFYGSLSELKNELYAHFGWVMYSLPLFFLVLSLLFFKIKHAVASPNFSAGFAIVVIGLLGLFHQGSVGEAMGSWVTNLASGEVSSMTYLFILVIGFIVMFNKSLDSFVAFILGMVDIVGNWFAKKLGGFGARGNVATVPVKKQLVIKGAMADSVDDVAVSSKQPVAPAPAFAAKSPPIIKFPPQIDTKPPLKITLPTAVSDMTSVWEFPQPTLLADGPKDKADRGDMNGNARIIEETLQSFGVRADVVEVHPGPAVTQYCMSIPMGTRVTKITSLSSDLAMALSAPTGQIRIEAPIPGRNLIGIEIPNRGLEFVTLKRMLLAPGAKTLKSKLSVALGLDVAGNPVYADIGKMPHVLIAGTTGSGKSVLVNAFITSLLFRTTPQEVKLILVDPKRVELTGYNGVPHLLTPVIVEPDKILSALHWAVHEMEERYKKFAEVGVRNIDGFNEMSGFQAMPYIVIVIDELADLMAYAPVDVEDNICRLAQMARAVGIHLVLATQRPSVDVITGLIKANVPSRIAFNVSSMVDSRVIIDQPGAEKLLGRGDMLYIPPDQSKPSRIQGTFVSENEVAKVVDFLKTHNLPVEYTEGVTNMAVPVGGKKGAGATSGGSDRDPLFEQAMRIACSSDKASTSLLQRRLSLGYSRAARIIDQLEQAGIVGAPDGSKARDVLVRDPDVWLATRQETGAEPGA